MKVHVHGHLQGLLLTFSLSSWLNHRKQQPHPKFFFVLETSLKLEGGGFGHEEITSINPPLSLLGTLAWCNFRSMEL